MKNSLLSKSNLRESDLRNQENKAKDRVELLYMRENERKAKLDHIRVEREAIEMAECTFVPNTVGEKYSEGSRYRKSRIEDGQIVDRLYATLQTKYDLLEEMKQERDRVGFLKDLKECTFKPKINQK